MNWKRSVIVGMYVLVVLSFVWMDATHIVREGNSNYSPEPFSLWNTEPWAWAFPLLGVAMLLLPWFWRMGAKTGVWGWSLFPCKHTNISRFIGFFLSLINLIVSFSVISLTIMCGILSTGGWYKSEDWWVMLAMYGFCGFIAAVVNLCYGLFSVKKYR